MTDDKDKDNIIKIDDDTAEIVATTTKVARRSNLVRKLQSLSAEISTIEEILKVLDKK